MDRIKVIICLNRLFEILYLLALYVVILHHVVCVQMFAYPFIDSQLTLRR